ncbi:MAG: hypothetical protein V3S98_06260 [Dehalococcoidia bacterium]
MITDKLNPGQDSFWDIKKQEAEAIGQVDQQIESCQRAITLCQRMTALSGNAGYDDMLKAVGELESHANTVLLRTDSPEEMWRLQGRVNALKDVRAIMANAAGRVIELDSELQMMQDHRTAILSRTKQGNKK